MDNNNCQHLRRGSKNRCLDCHARKAREYKKARRELLAAKQRAYAAANVGKVKAYRVRMKEKRSAGYKKWAVANSDWLKAKRLIRRACADPGALAAYQKGYMRNYRKTVSGAAVLNHHSALRRAMKRVRCPKWLTEGHREEMRRLYEAARAMTAAGLPTHVDHIVPLKGETVSGLHVPWNLQLLPSIENLRKRNALLNTAASAPAVCSV